MLYLRPFNPDDAKIFYRWYHDKRLASYFRGFVSGISIEQCRQAPKFMKAHILVGCESDTHRPIGAATYADTDLILRIYRMGLLVDPDYQHKDYGRFITTESIAWAFERMNAHKVVAEMLTHDQRLIAGCEKAGFVLEGTRRSSCYFQGAYHDEHVYSMLREDFDAVRGEQNDVQQY